ncbi:MAG: hypothetical protein U1D55_16405 [Phycisphaerae bacterium]
MHRFEFFLNNDEGFPTLSGAYLVGADGVPSRGEVRLSGKQIVCESRNTDPLGLSLLWPVQGLGALQLETTRLVARDKPYHLHVELARHRLLRISLKREEWGLFDYSGVESIAGEIERAQELFIAALQHIDKPREAARLADESLAASVAASEKLCQFHAGVFLSRRQQSGGFSRGFMGAAMPPAKSAPPRLKELLDFVRVPFVWREIQQKEQGAAYEPLDAWIKTLAKAGVTIRGGPLLNFGVQFVPDWMYIWENDYEAIVDFAREHVRRTAARYANVCPHWLIASGLHADSVFPFTFEQIVDLTRMAATTTRQVAPKAQLVIDLTQPWGEYFARNQRAVPPLLYAEMVVQAGISFDAFGIQIQFGLDSEGFHVRDLLQVSTLIDRLANLGKPLHVTALAAPSEAPAGKRRAATGGEWRGPWSEQVQADWLAQCAEVVLSRPFVESVCLQTVMDGPHAAVPGCGLLTEALKPKAAYARLVALRAKLQSEGKK